jgi:methylated-DNA-[protein]-cysteine S-methyltransferase
MHALSFPSPVGRLTLVERDGAIASLRWGGRAGADPSPLLAEARRQIDAYFAGALRAFDLPLAIEGTDFQRAVWAAMLAIPFGAVRTYGDVAAELGGAARAVGGACGENKLPILVPCHRIVAAGGALGGYSGGEGVATKRFLLALEGRRETQLDLFATKGDKNARHPDQGL